MSTIIKKLEAEQVKLYGNVIPYFKAGDTLEVSIQTPIENKKQKKNQIFQGLCIARKNNGWNSSFCVRRVTNAGHAIEQNFPLHSPYIQIKVLKVGIVRRAKLYYIRDKIGKKAKIKEKIISKKKA